MRSVLGVINHFCAHLDGGAEQPWASLSARARQTADDVSKCSYAE
jgi:hypothetical protein